MDKDSEERFAALETKVAYMEDYIDQLQQVSAAQSKQMDILRNMIQSLSSRIEDAIPETPNLKPPHY